MLEEQTEDGDTALTLAAEAGLVDNVRMLLRHGASPHNTNGRNESPLLFGRTRAHLQHQAFRVNDRSFPHSAAVRQGSYDMVLTLIMGGAFVEQVCLTKWTATHEAAKVSITAKATHAGTHEPSPPSSRLCLLALGRLASDGPP